MVKIYNWELRVESSEIGCLSYRLKTTNKNIGFTYDENNNTLIIIIWDNKRNTGEYAFPVHLPIENRPYLSGVHKKVKRWFPTIECSTGLPQRIKKDICSLLEKIE